MSLAIQKKAIDLLWRQWTAVGVAGNAEPPQQAIDIEAMIAFTPFVAVADPRLGDESADWCARVGESFISISRLRQITRLMPARAAGGGGVDLPSMVVGKRFSPKELSRKSRAPSLQLPCLLQLRSRYVFGVGARADVMSRLATNDRAAGARSAASINPVGYTKQAIAIVLDELSQAGVLKKLVRGRSVRYDIAKETSLRSLLAPMPPRMPPWAERFAIVATLLERWRQFGKRATYAIELAKALDQIRPTIASVGELAPRSGPPSQLLARIERWAISLLDDEVWEDSWMLDGDDLTDAIFQTLQKPLLDAVRSGGYPMGQTEFDRLAFRNVDLGKGTAQFRVRFTDGQVDGTLRFDPDSSNKKRLLQSLKVHDLRGEFDEGDREL